MAINSGIYRCGWEDDWSMSRCYETPGFVRGKELDDLGKFWNLLLLIICRRCGYFVRGVRTFFRCLVDASNSRRQKADMR